MTTIEKLTKFVNQRPGLDFANYGDRSAYRSEMAEITRDRSDYFELLSIAAMRIDNLNEQLTEYLQTTSGRLTLKDGKLDYCTGQYFPTEYRPAANNVLRRLIWDSYANETTNDMLLKPVYADGHEIRKALKRRGVSRRLMRLYFN